jgi:hypothetical protein
MSFGQVIALFMVIMILTVRIGLLVSPIGIPTSGCRRIRRERPCRFHDCDCGAFAAGMAKRWRLSGT